MPTTASCSDRTRSGRAIGSRCSPGSSSRASRSRRRCMREVFEESGIRVTDPVYLGSQPWPFPASLMLGLHGEGRRRAPEHAHARRRGDPRRCAGSPATNCGRPAARSCFPAPPRSPTPSSRNGSASRSPTECGDARPDELLAGTRRAAAPGGRSRCSVRSCCWREPAPARPARSPIGSRTGSRRACTRRAG